MIVLRKDLLKEMEMHARQEAPKEACGVIGGRKNKEKIVEKIYRCTNVDEIPEARYTIKSTELLEIMDEIEKEGIELIGFYHSHPLGPSYPSMIDKNRVSWPGYSYLIVSLLGKCSVTSWIWNGEKFEIEEILIR